MPKTTSTEPKPETTTFTPSVVPEPTPDVLAELNRARARIAELAQTEKDLREHITKLEENPLFTALTYLDAGAVYEEAGRALAELFETVQRREEKGKLTLTIEAKPLKSAVVYAAAVKVTEPKEVAAPAVLYVQDGKLTRQDPRQGEFGFTKRRSEEPED